MLRTLFIIAIGSMCVAAPLISTAQSTTTSHTSSLARLEQLLESLELDLNALSAGSQTASAAGAVAQAVPVFPTSSADFFSDLSQCILNRTQDASVLAPWVNNSSLTLSSVYESWFSSPEYVGDATSNQQFVTQLYDCIDFRQPDQGGYDGYVQALQSGAQTRASEVQIFVSSNEFLTNQGPRLTAATGIPISKASIVAPTATLTQSLTTTTESNNVGQSFTIAWSSTNATSCTLQKQGPAGTITNPWATGTSGSQTATPYGVGVNHFWIDCTGPGGNAHADVYHTVTLAPVVAVNTITANPIVTTIPPVTSQGPSSGSGGTGANAGNGSSGTSVSAGGGGSGPAVAVAAIPSSKNQFIADLYSCILSREPDASGLAAWTSLPASVTLGLIYQSWFASPEYLADNVPDQQFVTQLYNCILFRQPDAAGYNLYVQALQNNTQTRIGLVQTFVTSNEFLAGQGPQLKAATGFALAPAVDPAVTPAPVQTVTNLNQNDPYSWLVKSVCVNAQNQELTVDPYGGCPTGTTIRKMQLGDPLPYYNKNNYQSRWNNFPIQGENGQLYELDARQFLPDTDYQFRYGPGTDQYDLYSINVGGDGWVSAPNTEDGGGFATTFFGQNCELGGGWVFFPTTNFLSGGLNKTIPIAGDYWTQSGENFPGKCPGYYLTDSYSSWQLVHDFAFQSSASGPVKNMDAIVTQHGYEPTASYLQGGHIEEFFFTREYGLTRWEILTPVQQNPVADTTGCGNTSPNVTYQGQQFIVTDCVDNSDTVAATTPQIPVYPVANLNLLAHANFDPNYQSSWGSGGTSVQGNPISVQALSSTWCPTGKAGECDNLSGGSGVRYLQISCGKQGDTCTGWHEFVYQDLPASSLHSGTYAYGVSAHTATGTGTFGVTIQQLDANYNVVGSVEESATMNATNGADDAQSGSAYYTNVFAYKTFSLTLDPRAVRIRFAMTPESAQTFDVEQAFLAPWPVPTSSFAASAN